MIRRRSNKSFIALGGMGNGWVSRLGGTDNGTPLPVLLKMPPAPQFIRALGLFPLLIAALLVLNPGCAAPGSRSTVGRFPQLSPSRVWPNLPDAPRIRWIGEITAAADLGVRPEGGLLRALTGAPTPALRFAAPAAVAAQGTKLAVADPQHPEGATVHLIDRAVPNWTRLQTAAGAPLEWPLDVAFCDGRLAIADAKRKAVFLVNDAGAGTTIGAGALQRPASVAFDPQTRELFVVDTAAHDIAVFDLSGALRRRIGRRGGEDGAFNFPTAAAVRATGPAPDLIVADSMNFRAQRLGVDGAAKASFGRKGDAAGDFALPRDVAVDSDGHIYVLDSQFENVQIFDAEGRLLLAFAAGGTQPGELNVPGGIAIDERDWIWIADTRNRRVQVFEYLKRPFPEDAP